MLSKNANLMNRITYIYLARMLTTCKSMYAEGVFFRHVRTARACPPVFSKRLNYVYTERVHEKLGRGMGKTSPYLRDPSG